MQPGKPSFMAEAVAVFRAAHQVIDEPPRILDDPLAVPILGPDGMQRIDDWTESLLKPYLKRARALVLVRSQITESELAASLERGVSQYVLVGAGLDTSAYRLPEALRSLQVFEVDHPDTQRLKIERLRQAGIEPPHNVRYIEADFTRTTLAEALGQNGYRSDRPAFFSWLGVCCYLELDAIDTMLNYVGAQAPGSQIVFDFLLDNSELAPDNQRSIATASNVGKGAGEPWITAFRSDELATRLHDAGFSKVNYLSAEFINDHQLAGRRDGLLMDPAMPVMSGII